MTSLPHRRPRLALGLALSLTSLATPALHAQTGSPTSSQNQGTRPVGTSTAVSGTPTTLFAYGSTTTADIAVPPTDDGSVSTTWAGTGPEGSSLTMPFLNNSYGGLFVNTNGNLSFGSANTSFASTNLTSRTGPALLAPFFADVDTRLGTTNLPSGNIWYRTTQNTAELASITARLSATNVAPQNFNPVFAQIVTWDKVGRYGGTSAADNTKVSTFQAVLITDGSRTYTLFLYPENAIWWDNGTLVDYAGTFARIGYSAGNGVTGFEVTGSGTANARDLSTTSNIGQPGTFVFDVGGTATPRVVNGTLTLPSTSGTAANVLQLSANAAGHTITSTAAAGSILFNQLTFDNPDNTVAFTDRVVALANATDAISAGNLTFAGNAVLVVRATNALNGGALTLKDSAKLAIYAEGATTTASTLTFNKTSGTGGTFDLRGFNTAIGAVNSTGTTAGVIANSGATASTLTFGGTGTGTFNGVLQNGLGVLNLAKTGTGTQILSGTNTYTGTTTVSGGILQFTKPSAFYAGTVNATTAAKLTAQTGGIAAFSIGGTGEFSTAQLTTLMSNANFSGGALGIDTTNFTGGAMTLSNTFGTAIGFAKLGTGSLVLSGTPYTGATALHGGDLAFTYSPTFSSLAGTGGVLTLGTGQTALIDQTATTHFAGGIAGSVPLIKNGTGSLTLAGTNTYTGTTTINAGTLQFAKTAAFYNGTIDSTTAAKLTVASGATAAFNIGGTGEFTSAHVTQLLGGNFASGSTLAFDTTTATGDRFTYTGTLAGAIGFSKIGSGTLALGSASTYSGNFTLSGGALELAHSAALQNSTVIFDNPGFSTDHLAAYTGGLLSFGSLSAATLGGISGAQWLPLAGTSGAVALTVGGNHANTTFSGNFTGSGSLIKTGTGALTLSGANAYTGNTTVSGGTLQFTKTSAFYDGTINSTTAAKLSVASDTTVAFNVGGTGEFTAANIDTVINRLTANANNGAILGLDTTNATGGDFTYAGDLHLAHGLTKLGAGTLTLSSLNTYAGPTTVAAGTLKLSGSGSISPVTAVTINAGATFQPGATSLTIGSLAGAGSIVLYPSTTLTTGGDNTSTLFSGTLQGPVNLIKVGTGTFTLSGENTAISNTTVSAGTLQIGDGGTTGLIAGNISTATDTTVAFSHSDNRNLYNAVSGPGAFQKLGTGTLTLLTANTNTGATTVSAGTLRLGGFDRLSDSSALTVSAGASFNLNGFTEVVGSLAGAGTVTNSQAGPSVLLAGGDDSSTTFSGTLSGNLIFGKSGTGTLILTGASTHTGGTTVADGTLQIGTGGTSGSLGGNVVNQGDLIFNRSDALTFAGAVSGSGYLIKEGAGMLTLTGANTYTGTTIVFAGTLQIGNGGTSGSLTGNILNNAALTFNRSDALTYAGNISGTGTLTKLGAGTLTLSGANTYTGATTVSAGTLQIGNGSTTGSLPGNIVNNAALTFNRSDSLTYAGVISGTGSLTKLGSSQLLLTGANTYSGNTTISAGSLGIYRTDDYTYSGNIDGSGAFSKSGPGKLTLTGTNTFTGATTVSVGSLQIGNGGTTGSLTGNLSLSINGGVIFNRSDDFTYAGAIAGTYGQNSTITKLGAGQLTLSGNVAGSIKSILVDAGTLTVANSLSETAVTISNAAQFAAPAQVGSLAGAGTVVNNNNSYVSIGYDNSSTTFSGAVVANGSAGRGLLKAGTGTLTLASAATSDSTLGQVTALLGGTVLLGHSDALARSEVLMAGGALSFGNLTSATFRGLASNGSLALVNTANAPVNLTLTGSFSNVQSSSSYLYEGALTGSGSLTVASDLILTGTNTHTGGTTISSGTLRIGNGSTTGSLAGNIANTAALTFNRSDAPTYAGVISGTGTFTKTGAGTLTLSGANTYTGATTVSEGTLQIGAGSTTGSLANTALSIASGATVRFDRSTASTFAGAISGTGTLVKTGAGNLTFTGAAPSFQGPLLVNQGLLTLATGGNAIGDSSPVTIASGASISISGGDENFGSLSGAGSLLLATRSFGVNHTGTVEFSGTITDTGAVNKGGSGNWILSGPNTYTGTTTLNLGTLTAGSTTAFGTGTVRVNAGTLNLANYAVSNALDVRGGALTALANYAGTQTLSAAMTYAGTVGGTIVVANSGTLNSSGATFTGATTVQSGGTLSGTGTTGPLTFDSGSTLAPGNSPGTLHATGLTTLNGGLTYNWQLNRATGGIAGTNWDLLSITGALALNTTSAPINLVLSTLDFTTGLAGTASNITPGTNYTFAFASATSGIAGFSSATQFSLNTSALAGFGAGNWSISQTGNDLALTFTASAIPEPSTYAAIFGAATLALAAYRRRQKK